MSPPPWSPPVLRRRGERAGRAPLTRESAGLGARPSLAQLILCRHAPVAVRRPSGLRPHAQTLSASGCLGSAALSCCGLRTRQLAANMRWAWVAATVVLWPQLAFLGGSGARREPKRPRQSSQRPIAPSATTLGSEGLLGFPKVCMMGPRGPSSSPPPLSESGGTLGRNHNSMDQGTLSGPGEGVGGRGASVGATLNPQKPKDCRTLSNLLP